MLRNIKTELKRLYYDPSFRGRDLDALFRAAEDRIRNASTEAQISGILTQALLDLEDSHTTFIPPPLPYDVEYGFDMKVIGDVCRVVAVKPGSDAAAKDLRPGSAIRSIEGVIPTRRTLAQIDYALNVARPRSELRLVVQPPGGAGREMVVVAQKGKPRQYAAFDDWIGDVVEKRHLRRGSDLRTEDIGGGVTVAKLATFSVEDKVIDDLMKQMRGRRALILDLRDNPGGWVSSLQRLTGHLFDRDVGLGEVRERKRVKPLVAKQRLPVFAGSLVVLVDSGSASASEIFARVVQIERRGQVLGDRTAGAVMVSEHRHYTQGHEYRFLLYGLSITTADTVMQDGKSLEGSGASPDEVVLPSPEDLAAGRDPVLALAASRLDVKLDPERAGTLFPRDWSRR